MRGKASRVREIAGYRIGAPPGRRAEPGLRARARTRTSRSSNPETTWRPILPVAPITKVTPTRASQSMVQNHPLVAISAYGKSLPKRESVETGRTNRPSATRPRAHNLPRHDNWMLVIR